MRTNIARGISIGLCWILGLVNIAMNWLGWILHCWVGLRLGVHHALVDYSLQFLHQLCIFLASLKTNGCKTSCKILRLLICWNIWLHCNIFHDEIYSTPRETPARSARRRHRHLHSWTVLQHVLLPWNVKCEKSLVYCACEGWWSHLFIQRRLVIALGSKHSIHWLHHSCHFFFINGAAFVGIIAEIFKTFLWMLTLLLTCEKPILACLLESLHWRGPLQACFPWSPSNHSRRDRGSLVVMMKMHKDFVVFKSTTWIYDPESELFLILLATTLQTRCNNNPNHFHNFSTPAQIWLCVKCIGYQLTVYRFPPLGSPCRTSHASPLQMVQHY